MPNKESILTPDAPQPIGPYSQAIKSGKMLFCSGQIPIDPNSGEVLSGSVEDQTRLVMNNLGAVLKKGGASFDHVLKTTIFLKSMADFPKVNEVYGSFFSGMVPPARACVEVSTLPKNVDVEVEAVAALD